MQRLGPGAFGSVSVSGVPNANGSGFWSVEIRGQFMELVTFDQGHIRLVGGLEHFLFFHILGIIILTDFHIFQRG